MQLFASPLVASVLANDDGIDYKEIEQKSAWAARHWTFELLKPLRDQGNCHLNDQIPCSFSQIVDFVFLCIFAVEMVIKMLALGLATQKNAYLRSGWNWLDFIVVIVGFLDQFSSGELPGITTIRLVKTFRPLRSMQRIRGLRVLVQCILEALPQMLNVAIFLLFVLIIFGLFGMAFFSGKLRHACHECTDYDESGQCLQWESTGVRCDAECQWDDEIRLIQGCGSLGNGTMQMESQARNLRWTYSCRPGERCLCDDSGEALPGCSYLANPNYGITSFDSILWAMLTLFQAISLEGWIDMTYQLMDGCSMFVFIYFIVLVLIGAIIAMNLFLAVLCDNFDKADSDDTNPDEESSEEVLARQIEMMKHGNIIRQRCLDIIRFKYFNYFIQGCILLNTLLMCLKAAPQPANFVAMDIHTIPKWDYLPVPFFWFLAIFNIILTLVFVAELVLKMVALGWRMFTSEFMNCFDAFVVFFSIIEIALDFNERFSTSGASIPLPLSVLRAFRIFRLFKLVRTIDSLRKIISTLIQSFKEVFYLAMLLLLVMLIFILLGVELFGGMYPHSEYNYTQDNFPGTWDKRMILWEDDASRYHFDDFGTALLAIFVVLSGENWNEIMFNNHRATWSKDVASVPFIPWAVIYFVILFIVGNLLLFNLFVAILLSNFDDDDDFAEAEEEEDARNEAMEDDIGDAKAAKARKQKPEEVEYKFGEYRLKSVARRGSVAVDAGDDKADDKGEDEEVPETPIVIEAYPKSVTDGGGDKSLMIFSWNNPIRIVCCRVILHPVFEPTVLVLILVSTLTLVIDMPHLDMKSPLRSGIEKLNTVFTVLFTLEMVLKMVACGIYKSKTPPKYTLHLPYFASSWNILDCLIVLVTILSDALDPADQPWINQLRTFRAIRPLRLVSRYEALKITCSTLLASIPAMASLATVATLFFVIFGILGTELFGGKFGYCYDPLFADLEFGGRITPGLGMGPHAHQGANTDYHECMALPRYNLTRRTTDGILLMDMADIEPGALSDDSKWLNFIEFPQWVYPSFGNFDNIGYSFILLFEISALEGWPDVMHHAMDVDSNEMFVQPWRIDSNPIEWMESDVPVPEEMLPSIPSHRHTTSNIEGGAFFVLWIIFGCFVIVNLTVGIVVDTFSDIKAKNDGLLNMTEDQADWVLAQKQLLAQRPLKAATQPAQLWRHNFYYLVTSTRFDMFIMVVIMLNMTFMACDWFEPNPDAQIYIPKLKHTMKVVDAVFFFIYVAEMLLKWVGLGFDQYFKDSWCVFDCVLVSISAVDFIFTWIVVDGKMPFPAAVARCLRLFRVARILRIVKTAKSLRVIMLTVYLSLPQLYNIMILITLIILITDMLLVGFFWFVNYTPGNFDPSDHLDWTVTQSYRAGERYFQDDWHFDDTPGTNWGPALNRHANFGFFWTGALTLVRCSTGESFNLVMHDLYGWWWGINRLTCCPECGPMINSTGPLKQESIRIPSTGAEIWRQIPMTSCGGTEPGMIIYIIFQVLMAYVVLSIMVGVILENFANVGSENKRIKMEDIEDFREVWLKYDPMGTFIVPSHNLLAMLQQLREPLGIQGKTHGPTHGSPGGHLTRADMLKHLGELDIPDHNGYIHFLETLTALSNKHAGCALPLVPTTEKLLKANKQAVLKGGSKLDPPKHSALTNYLVSLLQSRWRGYAMRRQGDEMPASASDETAKIGTGKIKANQVAPLPPS